MPQPLSDEDVVSRVLLGETALYEIIMRRYNQRLYRVAWAIVRNAADAEDVIQDTYVRAYTNLSQFAGHAKFATWLTRIAVHEALARSRRARRQIQMPVDRNGEEREFRSDEPTPEVRASEGEARTLLESAIGALPPDYRAVFIFREVEGLSTAETAECLDINEDNVKIRLHRSRRMLRAELSARLGVASSSAFQFMGERCDRTVRTVLARILTTPYSIVGP
jgi:RNA polymerase sigma-70 factor (ECF subfamily)